MQMQKVKVAVACRNTSGAPDMPVFTVQVTKSEVRTGVHHDRATELAKKKGFKAPYLCFDQSTAQPLRKAAVEMKLVPTQVAIDISGGAVHQARCDQGKIDVLLYDDDDDTSPNGRKELPIGNRGTILNAWSGILGARACKHVPEIFAEARKPD